MAHHVKSCMRQGDKKGYPIIDADKGDVPPNGAAVYDATATITSFKAHMTKPHAEMPFLRAAPLNEAIEHLRSEGHPPVQVRASDMPTGIVWNNYPDCLYRSHAVYCGKEGLSRSSDMARQVLYFMFHGYWQWVTKNSKKELVTRSKPFIFFLHKKMVGARSRYSQKVPQNFSKFIELFNKHSSNTNEWADYLMDHGKGNPPVEYLIAFELGLREYASCVHSLGTRPLRTRKSWADVAKWRKCEAYIALARYLLKADTGYKQWDCFRFGDYTMRRAMALTFQNRHYHLSNGQDDDNFGEGKLDFDWDKHAYSRPKKVKSEPGEYKGLKMAETSATDERPMIFDVELGKLVPL